MFCENEWLNFMVFLLMLNSGAEPKDVLTAKTNEKNNFPCYVGRIFVHDGFQITPHFQ